MPLNMKVMLSTNHTVLDVNEKVLRSGKYFFSVEELTKENTVKGKIVHSKSENEDYEFRYFSFLLMTVKAQSVLARRAKIKDPRMPSFASPVKPPKKKKMKECSICLMKIKTTSNEKKLACGHSFHLKCIRKWSTYNKNCPNCRQQFKTLTIE